MEIKEAVEILEKDIHTEVPKAAISARKHTRVVKLHLEYENIYKAVFSGLGRLLALRSCLAGAGLAGRIGFASAAIKKRSLGVNFL